MDQKTDFLPPEVTEKDLGVGIRFATSVGKGRQIEMSAGIPLDWETDKINAVLDKLGNAMDRQAYRYELHDMKLQLEASEFQLQTIRLQRANYEQQQMADWEKSNKRGPWQKTESQRKILQNWDTNEEALIKDVLKRRKEIEEIDAQCH
jgi:hypothetical protein